MKSSREGPLPGAEEGGGGRRESGIKESTFRRPSADDR